MKTFSAREWLDAPSNDNKPATANKQFPASSNSEDTKVKVERVVTLIEHNHADITDGYANWRNVGFALSSEFQEAGRDFFHRVSRQNAEYNQSEADKQYDKCLSAKGDGISIATFFQMAKDAGIDISNPKTMSKMQAVAAIAKSQMPNEIQNSAVGTLDFWTFGSEDGQKTATADTHQAQAKNQISKNPKIQSDEIGSKWKLDEEDLPHFPSFIYDQLPPFLKEVMSNCLSEDDRDMLLMGSITCLSSTLQNVVGRYNGDDWHAMLFFFVMAEAGMGKGMLMHCRELVEPIHRELVETSEQQIREYKANKKNSKGDDSGAVSDEEEPHRVTLFIPTNSSAAAVIQQLDQNEGIGFIFDTECDSLTDAINTDYGNYSTILRKGYHHEPIDLCRRKDNEHRSIEHPMITLCLSGTPEQLYTLTPRASNGTFSRITCYYIPFKIGFGNVLSEGDTSNGVIGSSLKDKFHQLGLKYKRMREAFFRGGQYRVVIPQPFCDEFVRHFRQMNQETVEDISHEMQGIVRRLAFAVFRIMMVLTSIRFMDETPNPSALAHKDGSTIILRCTRGDFDTAMAMGDALIYHTVYCYANLPETKVQTDGNGGIATKAVKMERLFAVLPENFDRDAYRAASRQLGYPVSTTVKWINDYIRQGRLSRDEHNDYRKL